MEILKEGKDIISGVRICHSCGCTFKATVDDLYTMYEDGVQQKFFECPCCYTMIPVSTEYFFKVIKRGEEDGSS